jgi:hypothetical protein
MLSCRFCSEPAVTDAPDGESGRDLLCEGCLSIWVSAVYASLPRLQRQARLQLEMGLAILPVARGLFAAWAEDEVALSA